MSQAPIRTPGPVRARRPALAAAVLWVAATASGCVGVDARTAVFQNAWRDRVDRFETAHGLTAGSDALLRRHGMLGAAWRDPDGTAALLEAKLRDRPEAGGALALAELYYRAGLGHAHNDPDAALDRFRDAAVLAALALAPDGSTPPEAAAEVHNLALARLVRLAQRPEVRRGRTWQETLAGRRLVPVGAAPALDPARFTELTVAADLSVAGVQHRYKAWGVGVPLVARRVVDRERSPDPQESYFPIPLRVGATALVVPDGGLAGGAWRRGTSTLVFHDAFHEGPVVLSGYSYPLAHDRTAALAVQVDGSLLPTLEVVGLLKSSFEGHIEAGLYMIRPYQPGKIPVVLVHGLNSSPRAFVQTINELSNDPKLRTRYQFWPFLYPSGAPIPRSGAALREALYRARATFDPAGTDPGFDRTVVVGHSMGGLLTKMMVQDTGLELWDASIRLRPADLVAPPEIVARLEHALLYRPVPFVRRVVFIATPHRGSLVANRLVGRVVSRLIQGPNVQAATVRELQQLNGNDVVTAVLRGNALDSVDELRTDSPVLAALDRIPIDPAVPYHSIIPMLAERLGTDGVVPYGSSHLDGATSEKVIPGTHSAQQTPAATAELKRILLEHLGAQPGS